MLVTPLATLDAVKVPLLVALAQSVDVTFPGHKSPVVQVGIPSQKVNLCPLFPGVIVFQALPSQYFISPVAVPLLKPLP